MNALQLEFKNMTTRKVGDMQYFIFRNRGGDLDIYDKNLNYYGCWMDSETFLKRVRAGENLILQENAP